ncbi:MAG: signal transduction histidine kinase [uncultured archaeon A07HN63]|nr:MAG: signal transduction histidine kinase [uncultured archaeon A07HN63]
MRRQLSAGVISGLGVSAAFLTTISIVRPGFNTDMSELLVTPSKLIPFITESVIPFLFALIIIAVGYWTWIEQRPESAMVRLAGWCATGCLIIGGFEFLSAYSQFLSNTLNRTEWEVIQQLSSAVARGGVIGIAFGLFDIERGRAQRRGEELERQVERLEEFASVVSHDLRSPLTVAKGHIELIRAEYDLDGNHLAHIEFAHDRMSEIIEDSLTLARGGSEVAEKEPVELESVASRAWQTVGGGDGLEVAEMTVSADPERLQRILENLFRNSFDHAGGDSQPSLEDPVEAEAQLPDGSGQTTENVDVNVSVGPLSGEETGFYVEDDGPGIPPEDRDEVFEAGVSGAEMGSGLGLAIVRRVAEAHGWSVSVTEGSEGGARFEFHTDPE